MCNVTIKLVISDFGCELFLIIVQLQLINLCFFTNYCACMYSVQGGPNKNQPASCFPHKKKKPPHVYEIKTPTCVSLTSPISHPSIVFPCNFFFYAFF